MHETRILRDSCCCCRRRCCAVLCCARAQNTLGANLGTNLIMGRLARRRVGGRAKYPANFAFADVQVQSCALKTIRCVSVSSRARH